MIRGGGGNRGDRSCRRRNVSVVIMLFLPVFAALRPIQRVIIGDRKYVHPSVCLSVKRMNCDKTNKTSAQILTPYERSMCLVFRHEEWPVGMTPTWNFRPNLFTHPFKNADFQSMFARSASAVTPSEKSSIITNRKCHCLSNQPGATAYVALKPPRGRRGGGSKTKIYRFSCENGFFEECRLQSFFVRKLSAAVL